MQIVLTALDAPLADAWQAACGDLDFVEVHRGSIFDVRADTLVSPANSFGFMDGGIDMLYSRRFGWGLQERLQAAIKDRHHGELLVGQAEIVPTEGDPAWLIAAPTMRVPMILGRETVAPYLAARAVLLLVKHGERDGAPVGSRVRRVAFPGLGTGIGRVPPEVCARQVRAAIDEVVLGITAFPRGWDDAQERHVRLYADAARDLQYYE
ncbi:MAG: macro domain-containing protein [Sandaracinaceae bacterium]